MDNETPRCCTPSGCLIPELSATGQRVLELRRLLSGLHNLVDPATVINTMGGITADDLQLMAAVEAEISAQAKEANHGGQQ